MSLAYRTGPDEVRDGRRRFVRFNRGEIVGLLVLSASAPACGRRASAPVRSHRGGVCADAGCALALDDVRESDSGSPSAPRSSRGMNQLVEALALVL